MCSLWLLLLSMLIYASISRAIFITDRVGSSDNHRRVRKAISIAIDGLAVPNRA